MKKKPASLKVLKLNFEHETAESLVDKYKHVNLPTWAKGVIDFLDEFLKEDTITCFTSGTTGSPKSITLKKEQLIGSAKNTLAFFAIKAGDKVLLPLSSKHIAGKMMVVRALVGKLNLVVIEPSIDIQLLKLNHFKFSVVIPMQIVPLVRANDSQALHDLGKILIGGSDINQNMIEGLKEMNIGAWASFGMTETMSHFALRQLSPICEETYTCLPGFEISNNFNSQLKLKNITLGINEIQTNDVVNIVSYGSFIWLGRADNVVNSGGVKLNPELIERKIKSLYPQVPNFVIVGITDVKLGEKLVLFHEGESFLSKSEMVIVKDKLDQYEFPKKLKKVLLFDRTASGKIIRKNYTVK
ncbi:MAG: O-succinylbenzoic acid--CoA ligase [Glaciecola sp.]|jgi:O-succinylbenzoic acid--CoA ligase